MKLKELNNYVWVTLPEKEEDGEVDEQPFFALPDKKRERHEDFVLVRRRKDGPCGPLYVVDSTMILEVPDPEGGVNLLVKEHNFLCWYKTT